MQGAGGLIVPPSSYWPEVMRICRRYDILLHADEVITGFGRTGEWFGSYTYDLQPDIITMAKGLSSGYQPISAISLGPRMGDAIAAAGEELVHGYTYSGHPVACAVALKNLEVLQRDGIVTRVKKKIGPYFQRRVREVFADHPLVGEVRGVGMLAAMELVQDKDEPALIPAGTQCRHHLPRSLLREWPRDAGHSRHHGARPGADHHRKRNRTSFCARPSFAST